MRGFARYGQLEIRTAAPEFYYNLLKSVVTNCSGPKAVGLYEHLFIWYLQLIKAFNIDTFQIFFAFVLK